MVLYLSAFTYIIDGLSQAVWEVQEEFGPLRVPYGAFGETAGKV